MRVLSALIVIVWSAVLVRAGGIGVRNTLDDVQSDDAADEYLKGDSGVFLAPRAAKSVLRVRRWGIKSLWGEEQEEESESRERRHEASRRAQHLASCQRSCMGGWTGWSSCSVQCGSSGSQTRTRSPAPSSGCAAVISQHGCPGTRSQSQSCNRSCRNGGTLRATDCSCPAGYNGRCCDNRVTCGFPGSPTSGSVTPTGSRHYYGTTARYSCTAGYTLTGSATRSCQNNGQWSAAVPTCQIKNCGNPGAPPHGSASGSNFEFGRSVVFRCETGYTLSGQATLTCSANGNWNHPRPSCQIVQCPALQKPANGQLTVANRNYRTSATFQCNQGYYMQGSSSRTCQANGQWSGSQPACNRIECAALPAPSHGSIVPASSGKVPHGTVVRFSCQSGYVLHGTSSRTCSGQSATGSWSQSQPSCQPVDCGNPGLPENGIKEGGTYTFSSKVQFKCQPGYKMRGAAEITCASSGRWTSSKPSCTACELNTYKVGLSTATSCSNCPANSHTIATASSSKTQCICSQGYSGQAGGPCTEILCPNLTPPSNARLGTCSRKANSQCEMKCNDGHVVSSGSESRQCLADGTWAGSALTCQICPKNTYKSSSILCSRCPDHSSTSGAGNNLAGCQCNAGYTGPSGGPCQDLDECSQNHGCEQSCVNTPGSYRCSCSIPGYVQDADDPKSCLMKNSCPELSPPDNGGVACVQEASTNTARCQVKCNPGYEHILESNIFEECGPNTGWSWSNDLVDSPMLGCATALFEDIVLGLEVAYFTEDCSSLTLAQQREVAQEFISTLTSNGVCMSSGQATCKVGDVSVKCGSEEEDDLSFFEDWDFGFRKRRSTQSALVVKFKLSTFEASARNCSSTCGNGTFTEACYEECEANLVASSNSSIVSAAGQVGAIFRSPQPTEAGRGQRPLVRPQSAPTAPTISVGELQLRPMKGVRVEELQTQCPKGMLLHSSTRKCVECPAGTYLAPGQDECKLCPLGTHQPNPRQSECIPCTLRPNQLTKSGATSCDQIIELNIRPGGFLGHSNP